MDKKRREFPHAYVIIFAIIVLAAVATWLVPGGEFSRQVREVNGMSQSIIEPRSYHAVERNPQTWQVFTAIFRGMERTADIIFYILIIGGAFWLLNESHALDVAIRAFLGRARRFERWALFRLLGIDNIILTLIMLCFSFFGAVIGMSEETIAFVVIFVPLAIGMGYDSIVGVSLCFLAAGLGFAGALLNPFSIGIAQGLAGIPLFSGLEYRVFIWLIVNTIGIGYVLRYAHRIKQNPRLSPVYESDTYWRSRVAEGDGQPRVRAGRPAWAVFGGVLLALLVFAVRYPVSQFAVGHGQLDLPVIPVATALWAALGPLSMRHSAQMFIVNMLMFTVLFLVVGVMGYGWYISHIASLFMVMGLASGLTMGYRPNRLVRSFISGVSDIVSAALVVGLASGIVVVLEDGKVIDTLLNVSAHGMQGFGRVPSVAIMYLFYNLLNLIIASGSAKAALTIPLMSQLSDLIGISRQATVTIYQLGGGFTNMATPTSGVLMGAISVAKIPYTKWLRWFMPLLLLLVVVGFLLLLPPLFFPISGF
ncbi:MAG: YfcC family protein, partial [Bacteroidales bacterium]|nr:YfcC family protein [Bacteroidales bacterium]